MDEFPKQPLKEFDNKFGRISLLFQNIFQSYARSLLPTVQLDFSWTLKLLDQQNDWFARRVQHYIIQRFFQNYLRIPSQKFFWKSLKFKIRHCKNFQCPLSKMSLHYQTVIDQRLTVFHQRFSWTSGRPLKCRDNLVNGLFCSRHSTCLNIGFWQSSFEWKWYVFNLSGFN